MEAERTVVHDRRVPELDGVRGIAALAVLLFHLPLGFSFGATGVDLFFVLSGFLISTIIVRNCERPGFLRTFYWRRALRIFPIYYLALIVALCFNVVRRHPQDISGLPYYLVYLQHIHQYWGEATPPADISIGHTWTLAIEEQFYLLWPITLLVFGRRGLLWSSLALIVLPVILRSKGLPMNVLFGHTDGLAWGGLLAWLNLTWSSDRDKAKRAMLFGGVAVLGALAYYVSWRLLRTPTPTPAEKSVMSNVSIAIVSVLYFGVIGVICNLAGRGILSPLRWKVLVFIGQISYGLYLYHWIIYELLDTFIKFRYGLGDPWWLNVLKVAVSFLAAVCSWFLIEAPLMRFKDRFSYKNPQQSVPLLADSPALSE